MICRVMLRLLQQYLQKVKSISGWLTRWAMQLQLFAYTIKAIPGRENIGADFLSCSCDEATLDVNSGQV